MNFIKMYNRISRFTQKSLIIGAVSPPPWIRRAGGGSNFQRTLLAINANIPIAKLNSIFTPSVS